MASSLELARNLRAQLQADIDQELKRISEMRSSVMMLDVLVARLTYNSTASIPGANAPQAPPADGGGQAGKSEIRESIKRIMAAAGRPLRDRDVLDALDAIDSGPNSEGDRLAALRATLNRMVRADELLRLSPGLYEIPTYVDASTDGPTELPRESLDVSTASLSAVKNVFAEVVGPAPEYVAQAERLPTP